MLVAKENQHINGALKIQVVELFVQRIFNLYFHSSQITSYNAADLLNYNLADPIKVFVKEEPHTLKKLDAGRIRIISSVSLVDQMVERFCHYYLNQLEIQNHRHLPSKPGMGLHDEGLLDLYDYMAEHVNPPISLDVSAWDWSMQAYEFAADFIYRRRLAGWDRFTERVAYARTRCIMLGTFVCSNKVAMYQIRPGIQKSGSFNTASTNSHVAVMLAYRAGATGAMAMGDDCLATGFAADEAVALYKALGKSIQLIQEDKALFSFCSTTWYSRDNAVPENVGKMFYRYLIKSPVERALTIASYRNELRNLPREQRDVYYAILDALLPDEIDGVPIDAFITDGVMTTSDDDDVCYE